MFLQAQEALLLAGLSGNQQTTLILLNSMLSGMDSVALECSSFGKG